MSPEPTTIGRYEIQRVLGRGAMGIVYLTLDPLLKRLVAIKVVHNLGEDRVHALARFQREAEISAKLNHPNIVTVFDVGQDPVVGPFLAMEFIEGASLAKCIRVGLSPEEGIRLMVQGMGALQAAVDAGIVHRDIKPENILVSLDGRFKLMDFGIARRDESHLTQAGMIFGTPAYTAPELLTGNEASVSTDRYAFAVTAFEVVTNTLPFQSTSVGSTIYRIVHEAPTFPPGTNPYLRNVFTKALAKDPLQRYPDLPSFMFALVEAMDLPEETKLKLLAFITGDRPYVATQPIPPVPIAPEAPAPITEPPATAPPPLPDYGLSPNNPGNAQPVDVVVGGEPAALAPAMCLPKEPDQAPVLPSVAPAVASSPPPPMTADAPGPAPTPNPRPAPRSFRIWWTMAGLALLVVITALAWRFKPVLQPTPLEITTLPAGALVTVNGQSVGESPISMLPPPGQSTFVVEANLRGYLGQRAQVAQGARSVVLTLTKNLDAMDIISDPEGAEVLLGGQSMGRTPLKGMPLPASGTPKLILRLEGYEEWSTKLDKDLYFPEVINLHRAPKAKRRK